MERATDGLSDAEKEADDFSDEVEDAGKQSEEAGGKLVVFLQWYLLQKETYQALRKWWVVLILEFLQSKEISLQFLIASLEDS